MALSNEGSSRTRWIPVSEAADLIGKRFHTDWSASDPTMLMFDAKTAPDKEAWHRASNVEEKLRQFVAGGFVKAYALADDGIAMTDLPTNWVSDPVFKLCLRTGQFRQGIDGWEPLWVDQGDLVAALPAKAQPRQKHKFEWAKIVHEAWMFALRAASIPTKAQVERHLGEWCSLNNQGYPDASHLSEVARIVINFLNENKSGRQDLNLESCEAGDDSGE